MAKTRTITFRGTITDGIFALTTQYLVPRTWMDMSLPVYTLSALGFQITSEAYWDGSPGVALNFRTKLTLTCPSPFGGSNTSVNAIEFTAPVGTNASYSTDYTGGTFEITVKVEEVPTRSASGTFPTTFGSLVVHGPTKTTAMYRERVRVDASAIVIAATLGAATLTQTIAVTSGTQFFLDTYGNDYGTGASALMTAVPNGGTASMDTEIDLGGTVVSLSCPLTGSDGGHSVSSVSATAPSGVRNGAIHRTLANATIWPVKEWELYTYFRAMEDAYPSNVDVRVDREIGDTNHLVSCPSDGTLADSEEQERYSAFGQFSDQTYAGGPYLGDFSQSYSGYSGIVWSTSGLTQPTSLNVNQYLDFQCGIDSAWLTAQQEEPEDWRLFVQSDLSDSVGTLTHEPDYTVEDGSNAWTNVSHVTLSNSGGYVVLAVAGGTGEASRSLAPTPAQEQPGKMDWQAAQQLEVILQANASSKPFTIEVNGKEWSGTTNSSANTDSTVLFDLRAPHNATADTDSTQSRWPIGTEGDFFGVNATPDIVIKDLESGVTYKINSIKLVRQTRSKVCFGLPTRPWLSNGVGSSYLRHVFAESYKVALEIAGMYVTGTSPGWPSVQDFFDSIDIRPEWSAVDTATAAQLAADLMYLGGIHGAYYDGAAWQHSIDLDATAGLSVVLAESADVIQWYPYMGIPGGSYQKATPMYVGKVLRGRVGAVVIDPATHEGASGVDVTYTGGASVAETVGTDAEGFSRSEGRKYGSGTVEVNGNTVSVSQYNRWIAWSGFSEATESDDGLSVDFSPAQRFVRAYNKDGTIRLAFANDANWLTFTETDTAIAGNIREVRWERRNREARLFLLYLDGADLWLAATKTEGASFSMSTQLATDATQAANAAGENSIIYSYWRDSAGAIKGKLLDFNGNTIQPLPTETSLLAEGFEVLASGSADDKDIAVSVTPSGDGDFVVVLDYYDSGGALTQITSTNGRAFS